MKLRYVFLVQTIVSLIFAIALLLGPAVTLQYFGLTQGNTEKLLAQVLGSGLVGFALLSWFAKDFSDPKAREGGVISLLVFNVIGFVVSLLGVLSKVTRSGSAWIVVILFLIFAVGLAYYPFMRPSEM